MVASDVEKKMAVINGKMKKAFEMYRLGESFRTTNIVNSENDFQAGWKAHDQFLKYELQTKQLELVNIGP